MVGWRRRQGVRCLGTWELLAVRSNAGELSVLLRELERAVAFPCVMCRASDTLAGKLDEGAG